MPKHAAAFHAELAPAAVRCAQALVELSRQVEVDTERINRGKSESLEDPTGIS
jgi:hypothetical protein